MTAPTLVGRVAWVTGANRGLGRAIALRLAAAGADLVLTARNEELLKSVQTEVGGLGADSTIVTASVADQDAVESAVVQIEERWGKLDVLVNNAGTSPSFERPERISVDVWRTILDVNLTGPFLCSRAAHPLLKKSGGASIVNVSSIHGRVAGDRVAAYAASKGGLEMLTKSLAAEWARDGIRVNTIAPGYLTTEMTQDLRDSEHWNDKLLAKIPMGRFGEVDEVAEAVLFLSSPQASYVTGASLVIDGGWTAM